MLVLNNGIIFVVLLCGQLMHAHYWSHESSSEEDDGIDMNKED